MNPQELADESLVAGRHEATRAMFRNFDVRLFERPLRPIAAEVAHSARTMIRELEDSPELTVGLRKLLEARDCFVRAASSSLNADRG